MRTLQYGERFRDHFLEQYKLYVEIADRQNHRREINNRIFIGPFFTLATAYLALQNSNFSMTVETWIPNLIAIVGLYIALAWLISAIVGSFVAYNKLRIIKMMESSLPFQGFKEEERLVNGSDKSFQIIVVLSDLALPILAIILFIILYYALVF